MWSRLRASGESETGTLLWGDWRRRTHMNDGDRVHFAGSEEGRLRGAELGDLLDGEMDSEFLSC